MPFIQLTTFIEAPVERVFDLSRSIDLHKASMKKYNEKPIAGTVSGLIEKGETVTWTAKHLFKERRLKVGITAMQKPFMFIDEQVEGDFKVMKHEHYFKPCDNGTIMIDQIALEAPYGIWGKFFSAVYLTKYFEKLIQERNNVIKTVAESNQWKLYLDEKRTHE